MPKYLLRVEAEFTSVEPLSREKKRTIVRGLRDVYVKQGALEADVYDALPGAGLAHVEKHTAISFEPLS